ncbi:MAG: Hpt domain-containing protein [Lachnospiraceae bacterium]|nr:Hpt domain-containing protein [Lachnospiraceae bacterium]
MMTVRNCYNGIGSYEKVSACFHSDEKIKRFLRMFLEDENYGRLKTSLEQDNTEDAFVAAHTLKGICQNLSLDKLYNADVEVTEALRAKNLGAAKEKFPRVKEEYEKAFERISQIEL